MPFDKNWFNLKIDLYLFRKKITQKQMLVYLQIQNYTNGYKQCKNKTPKTS